MPVEIRHSPPPLHQPSHTDYRPKGILKNPSFSGSLDRQTSPEKPEFTNPPPSASLDPKAEQDLTLQNTIQNAGHKRSSSAARRASASRRHSSAAGVNDDDPNKMRLQWDEANLYLAEQEKGGRMKITEPKTPYQYGGGAMEDDEEEDVAIDPRYVNVDEVDMAKNKSQRKARESEIPGLDIGEPEEEFAQDARVENSRILPNDRANLSREGSKEKHVSVGGDDETTKEQVGMPTLEEQEQHRHFEEQRRKHYEMRNMKGLLGHPENLEDDDDDDDDETPRDLPERGVNGTR